MANSARGSLILFLGLVAAGLSGPTSATNRRLRGQVTDAAGEPVAGVTVTLVNVGGRAPEMSTDRSAINSDGAGTAAYAAHNSLPWQQVPAVGSEPAKKVAPLKIVTSDHKGDFSFSTLEFVGAVAVTLEKPGFETTAEAFGFPLGITKRTFVLNLAPVVTTATVAPETKATTAPATETWAVAQAAFDAGIAHAKLAQWPDARAAFERVVEITPDSHQAWLNLAIAQLQLDDLEGALASARRVLALAPAMAVANSLAADALTRLGRPDEAAAYLPAVAAEAEPAVAARLAFNDGAALLKSGDQRAAVARFLHALATDPALVDAHFALGLTHASLGETTEARTHLTRFRELAPQHPKASRAAQLLDELGR